MPRNPTKAAPPARKAADLLTVAEATDYRQTSLHKDVLEFVGKLAARTDHLKVLSMGQSGLGQEMPVLVLSKKKLFTPDLAHASDLPVVMVTANIHAGEVEGKEALLMLAREITTGSLARLMTRATLVLIPNYNPDGNDRIDPKNRALNLKALEGQVGPEGGVGTRYTGEGINLNRDYTKLEAVESRHLSKLFGEWRPHVFVDCHTTDGSIHGYDLTYDTSHTVESGPKNPILYMRDTALPAIGKAVRKRTGYRSFFYGNFRDQADPTKGWETYPALPRYGSHYRGLTGRLDILLETYSYIDFHRRCDVIYEFLVEIMDYAGDHADDIVRIVKAAEDDTVARGKRPTPDDLVGINYGVAARDGKGGLVFQYPPHPLYAFDCEAWDPESQRDRVVPGKKRQTYKAMFYARFLPVKSVRRPVAYVLPSSESKVAEHLRLHNIRVDVMQRGESIAVEHYVVMHREVTHSPDVGTQKRTETVFWVRSERGEFAAAAGDFIVRMDQPLANLAIYLLEPESDDGYARWGFFDGVKPGDLFPVRRMMP
jgi:hypothetical protein